MQYIGPKRAGLPPDMGQARKDAKFAGYLLGGTARFAPAADAG